jgi:hypothetical protein
VAKYGIRDVKADAIGHWGAVLERVAGIGDDYQSTTHGPCPKCGGNDRWRVFDDFAETGGAICNQCGKFGDGLAVVQWFTGWGFPVTLQRVAEFLGTAVADASRGKGEPVAAVPSLLAAKPSVPKLPSGDVSNISTIEILDNSPQTEGSIAWWCYLKKLSVPAVKSAGARVGRYRKRYRVIAFPVVAVDERQIGWTIYDCGGQATLPQFKAGSKEPVGYLKVKTIKAKALK